MLAIAHRSGNTVAGLRAALDAGVDLVEADVHAYRGRLEMRHLRSMGGLPFLWDREGVVRAAPAPPAGAGRAGRGARRRPPADDRPQGRAPAARAEGGPAAARGVARTVAHGVHQGLVDAGRVRRPGAAGAVGGHPAGVAPVAGAGSTPRPVDGVSVRLSLLTPEVVAELHRGTDLVMAWPVDTPEALAQARRVGADAVISKDLDLLRGVLADR